MEPRLEIGPSARRWLTVSRIASREIRARTRVLVESEPEPLPPKSVLELDAISDEGGRAGGEVTFLAWFAIAVELELAMVLVEVEASRALILFLGDTTLATRISLRSTASNVMSSKSKLGRRCGDSILACPSCIFGGGVSGRSGTAALTECTRLARGLRGGESVLNSSEWALDPDSEAGDRGVVTLAP